MSQKPTTAEEWWTQHAALLAEKMKIGGVDSFKIQRTPKGTFEFEVTPTHFHDCTGTTNGVGKITAPQRIG